MTKKIKVLHIGHSPRWRGGENQVHLLIQAMNGLNIGIEHHLAYPHEAIIFNRVGSQSKGNLTLPSSSPIDIRSVIAIIKYCRENEIDIMHAHSGNAHTLAYYAKYFLPKVKLIVHRRIDSKIKRRRSTRKKFLSNSVDGFIVISNAVLNNMKNYGVDENKIRLITDSIDTDAYGKLNKKQEKRQVINQYGWNIETPLIGFISALTSEKNPELFVEVVKHLYQQGLNFNVVIAGDGKQTQSVSELINDYELNDRVKMLGFVTNVKPLFLAIDIFVLPSRHEGLGTVLLEASSAEAAIVASDVGGISEVVIDKKTGLLVKSGKVENYADSVKKLIEDVEYRDQLIVQAKEYVDNKFNLKKMALETAQFYRELIH